MSPPCHRAADRQAQRGRAPCAAPRRAPVPAVGGHPGFACGAGDQRRVDARLREDAALMGICGREGKGPPTASGRRRPSCLVSWYQGAFENEKMSELPNVELAGQEVGGFGGGFGVIPSCRFSRKVSTAGQSCALRVSFHTATPKVLVAAAYT